MKKEAPKKIRVNGHTYVKAEEGYHEEAETKYYRENIDGLSALMNNLWPPSQEEDPDSFLRYKYMAAKRLLAAAFSVLGYHGGSPGMSSDLSRTKQGVQEALQNIEKVEKIGRTRK